jgi:hypothetical protein
VVRIVIRDLVRTLTSQKAKRLRDTVYASLHESSASQLADEPPAFDSAPFARGG